MQNLALVSALAVLRRNASARLQYRRVVGRAAARFANRRLVGAFHGWQSFVDERQRNRHQISHVLTMVVHRKQLIGFARWKNICYRMRLAEAESRLHEKAGHHERDTSSLRERYEEERTRRIELEEREKLANEALSMMRERLLRRITKHFSASQVGAVFPAWKAVVDEERAHRSLVERFAKQWRQRGLAATFRTWSSFAENAKRERHVDTICARSTTPKSGLLA